MLALRNKCKIYNEIKDKIFEQLMGSILIIKWATIK